ncbi:MAG: DUF4124 domain-containing protein [Methylophagaceae bacterium]
MTAMKLLWIALFCVMTSAQAVVYRWHDENGRVVYSDEFHPNAEIIDMPSLSTYVPTPVTQPVITLNEDPSVADEALLVPDYQIKITSPENDGSIWGNDGNISVSVDINPELDSEREDKLIILVDNQQQGSAIGQTNFTLSNLDRGTHSVVVSVVDNSGKVLKLSPSVTFHLHRRAVTAKQ